MAIFNAILQKPKGIRFESQEKEEQLYFLLRRHPITNLGWITLSIALVFAPLFIMSILTNYSINTFKYVDAEYVPALESLIADYRSEMS